jgi:hypothetical protein
METRLKERMDVISEHLHLAGIHKDKKLKITDEVYYNFGKSYYYIEFGFYNEDDTKCYDIIPYKNRISWYIHHEEYKYIKEEDTLNTINQNIQKDYEWVTSIMSYFLPHESNISYYYRPKLISREDTMIKDIR